MTHRWFSNRLDTTTFLDAAGRYVAGLCRARLEIMRMIADGVFLACHMDVSERVSALAKARKQSFFGHIHLSYSKGPKYPDSICPLSHMTLSRGAESDERD